MALFDGVQNFTPAFEGQRIAIGAGQGAGQSISRGMALNQRGREMEFERFKYNDMVKQLKLHDQALSAALGGWGDFGGETMNPDAIR